VQNINKQSQQHLMENQIEISDINTEENNTIEEQQIISVNKFIVLSILSFGLYEIWWIYKSWRFFQQKDKLDILPIVRTIFSIFFLIPLFNKILDFANGKGYNRHFSSVLLFIGYIIVTLLANLPDPFWLISFLSIVFFIPSFNALNFARQNSTNFIVTEQLSYNRRQITIIIIGAIIWVLFLLGMIIGDV
jgi:hypothetical protein